LKRTEERFREGPTISVGFRGLPDGEEPLERYQRFKVAAGRVARARAAKVSRRLLVNEGADAAGGA
jgi:hypothetical protein